MISLKDIIRGWNRFFFEPQSPTPIAVYRILLGLVVLANYALLLPDVGSWFGPRGVLSFEAAAKLSGGTGFNLFWWLPHTDAAVWTLFLVSCLAAVLVTIGLFTRASSIVLFLTLVTFHHRNALILNSGDTFLRAATFFLIFSQAGAAYSMDRLIRVARGKESGPPQPRAPWAMRLIQIQLAFLYFYAFVWKAMGAMWLSGTAIYYTSRLAEFWRFPLPYVFEHVWTIKLWTWGTLVLELALGTLIWVKELRYWVLVGGVLLHAGIEYTMNIPLFGLIMVSAYITFIEPIDIERSFASVKRAINSRRGTNQSVPVLYDGKCEFCRRSIEVLRRLDILGRLDYHNMHDAGTHAKFSDFDPERGEKEMLVQTPGGWLGGFFGIRHAAAHIPLLWPVLPMLYLPPVRALGDRLYQRIAARRYCIFKPEQYASGR